MSQAPQTSLPPLTVIWSEMAPQDWAQRLKRVPRSNLLQSFAYGRAMRLSEQRMPKFGLIQRNGEEIGLVQIQEARLLGLHTLVLDRGPLWYAGRADAATWEGFWRWFDGAYPRRFLRYRRLMPEMAENAASRQLLAQTGLTQAAPAQIGHRSLWVDLGAGEDKRLKDLSKGWRSALSKSERSGLTLEVDRTGRYLPWLLHQYAADKAERAYPGPKPKLVRLLSETLIGEGHFFLFRALKNKAPVAACLILGHGRSATYQIGWTGEAGRAANAHHFLLWHAAPTLLEAGILDLDLGGVNPEQAEGVTRFKKGMGGEAYEIVPIFR